jgi:hypothetical protein
VCKFTATTPAYYLEPGEIFEFTSPSWEIGGEFSGRALDGSTVNKLVPSWEPILHSGVTRQTAGNTLVETTLDFTQLVEVADIVATMDGSVAHKVTAVTPTTLTLSGALPPNQGYKILDLTITEATTLTWDAWNATKQYKYDTVTAIYPEWDAALKRVVYTGGGDIPAGSTIVLAERHWLWRCSVVEPMNAGAFRIYGTVFYPGHDQLIRTHLIT